MIETLKKIGEFKQLVNQKRVQRDLLINELIQANPQETLYVSRLQVQIQMLGDELELYDGVEKPVDRKEKKRVVSDHKIMSGIAPPKE